MILWQSVRNLSYATVLNFDTEISDPTFGRKGKVRMDFALVFSIDILSSYILPLSRLIHKEE